MAHEIDVNLHMATLERVANGVLPNDTRHGKLLQAEHVGLTKGMFKRGKYGDTTICNWPIRNDLVKALVMSGNLASEKLNMNSPFIRMGHGGLEGILSQPGWPIMAEGDLRENPTMKPKTVFI